MNSCAKALCVTMLLAAAGTGIARADAIDDVVTAQMKKQNIPGLSIAVLKNGKAVKTKGYGYANLESGVRATPETVYEIGSVSKQFLSATILLLVRDGKLSLDDSVRKYLPDAPEAWQPITLRHLLTHTSGLVRDAPGMQEKKQSDIEAIRSSYVLPLSFKPGDRMEYSNLGYFTLAEIITRAAQKPWPEYIRERIFAPLGMTATRTTSFEDVVAQRARGYVSVDGRFQNALQVMGVRPSGAFLSTVVDLSKWDAALYSDVLLTAAERELMWKAVRLNDGSVKNYGFGWEVSKVGAHRLLHHAGTMLGYRAEVERYVDDRLTVIVLSNSGQALVEKVGGGIAALEIDGLQPRRKAVKLPERELDAFVGKYQLNNGVLTVVRRERLLALTIAAGPRTMDVAVLTPEGKARFFDEDNPRPTYVFEVNAQGKMDFVARNEDGKETMRGPQL